ncbi:MAG TPA: PilZ domain-containing protein [bacterium]|nr:PilZ domain-containing protein [bacterium]
MKKINLSLTPTKPDEAGQWPEKRKHYRADLSVKVTLYPVTENPKGLEVPDHGFEAKSCDISENGIRLELNDTDPLALILKLEFKIDKKNFIEIFARLIWQIDEYCGFQCIVMSDEARAKIRDYVKKHKKAKLSRSRKKRGGRPLGSKNGGKVSWS